VKFDRPFTLPPATSEENVFLLIHLQGVNLSIVSCPDQLYYPFWSVPAIERILYLHPKYVGKCSLNILAGDIEIRCGLNLRACSQ
jgi:hypothetical protein